MFSAMKEKLQARAQYEYKRLLINLISMLRLLTPGSKKKSAAQDARKNREGRRMRKRRKRGGRKRRQDRMHGKSMRKIKTV